MSKNPTIILIELQKSAGRTTALHQSGLYNCVQMEAKVRKVRYMTVHLQFARQYLKDLENRIKTNISSCTLLLFCVQDIYCTYITYIYYLSVWHGRGIPPLLLHPIHPIYFPPFKDFLGAFSFILFAATST